MSEPKAGAFRHAILVVDDEADITRSIYDLLRLEYDVYKASSGAEALAILRQIPVHIIIADQRMPGMTGAQLLARVRGMASDVVRLMMTAYADIQVVTDAINRGHVFRYIPKPWNADELRGAVAQAAGQYNLLAERRRLIQELTAANEELRQIGALKTAFMEMSGHELRTPITYIQGMADLLARTPDDKPFSAAKDKIARIAANARKLTKVVEGMSKSLQSGRFVTEGSLEEFDLGPLVEEVYDELQPFLDQRNQHLSLQVAEHLPKLRADRSKVRDILTNLLTNAIRFTPDRGEIAFEAEFVMPDFISLAVADNGIGIEPDDLPHIFEPFYGTSDVSHHSTGGGLEFGKRGPGLGLTIVKRFTELHGGRVEVKSKPKKGSRFTVFLPVRAKVAGVGDAASERSGSAAGLSPLDDD